MIAEKKQHHTSELKVLESCNRRGLRLTAHFLAEGCVRARLRACTTRLTVGKTMGCQLCDVQVVA